LPVQRACGKDDATVWSPAEADGRTIANGMFYANKRLVVLGRQMGLVYVYNTDNKQLLAKLSNGLSGVSQTFLNDVVIAPDGTIYVTDSVNPELYTVSDSSGTYVLRRFMAFGGTPIQYIKVTEAAGINLNGIAATPDGKYLIVGKRNENALFRITLANKAINRISIDGTLETNDGLFLNGATLYAAQNNPNNVAVLTMGADYANATVTRSVADTSFAFVTGVQRYGDKLLVVSSQFNTLGSPAAVSGTTPPRIPFWMTELPEK
jgi:DNA-binding beta-propeller fold protein YncE